MRDRSPPAIEGPAEAGAGRAQASGRRGWEGHRPERPGAGSGAGGRRQPSAPPCRGRPRARGVEKGALRRLRDRSPPALEGPPGAVFYAGTRAPSLSISTKSRRPPGGGEGRPVGRMDTPRCRLRRREGFAGHPGVEAGLSPRAGDPLGGSSATSPVPHPHPLVRGHGAHRAGAKATRSGGWTPPRTLSAAPTGGFRPTPGSESPAI